MIPTKPQKNTNMITFEQHKKWVMEVAWGTALMKRPKGL